MTEHSTTPSSPSHPDSALEDVADAKGIDTSVLALFGQRPLGRIPVLDVQPVVDGGERPTKSVVHELFTVSATVFREGHDAVNATVVLTDPDEVEHHVPMTQVNPGLGHWQTVVYADPSSDMTRDVIYNLNLRYKKAGGVAPKAATTTPATTAPAGGN